MVNLAGYSHFYLTITLQYTRYGLECCKLSDMRGEDTLEKHLWMHSTIIGGFDELDVSSHPQKLSWLLLVTR